MREETRRLALCYAGLPLLGAALLLAGLGRLEGMALFRREVLLALGYLAAVSDLREKRVPNGLVLALPAAWILTLIPQLFLQPERALWALKDGVLGALLGGGLFLVVYLVSRKGLGGGDVKFMAAAGLFLGAWGVLPSMLYGSVLAGLFGLGLILLKRIGRRDAIPLIPFLYVGILITLFCSQGGPP